jgi:hypothetical protein
MPRACTICVHPERQSIEDGVSQGLSSYRIIANRYRISVGAIQRHVAGHLMQAIQQVKTRQEEQSGSRALDNLALAEEYLITILRLPLSATGRDIALTIRVLGELRQQSELRAKLEGELDGHSITITAIPEWQELRTLLLETLSAHPQARRDVIHALEVYHAQGA